MKNPFPKEPLFTLYAAVTAIILLFYAVLPRESFSVRENRRLTTTLTYSENAAESLHAFSVDSFPFRECLVGIASTIKSYLFFGESNGVIREGNTLTERRDSFDTERFAENLAVLSAFADETGLPFLRILLLHPSDYLHGSGIRYTSPVGEKLRALLIENSSIPASDALTRQDYYNTDHHLNESGIAKILPPLFSALGEELPRPASKERLDGFLGSAYRKSGLLFFPSETLYLPHFDGEQEIQITAENRGEMPLYDEAYKAGSDKYAVFLGGNYPLLHMRKAGEGRETLLIIKDSYANALFPYLVQKYDLVAVDPRYFRGNLREVKEAYGATRLLLLAGGDLLANAGISLYYE